MFITETFQLASAFLFFIYVFTTHDQRFAFHNGLSDYWAPSFEYGLKSVLLQTPIKLLGLFDRIYGSTDHRASFFSSSYFNKRSFLVALKISIIYCVGLALMLDSAYQLGKISIEIRELFVIVLHCSLALLAFFVYNNSTKKNEWLEIIKSIVYVFVIFIVIPNSLAVLQEIIPPIKNLVGSTFHGQDSTLRDLTLLAPSGQQYRIFGFFIQGIYFSESVSATVTLINDFLLLIGLAGVWIRRGFWTSIIVTVTVYILTMFTGFSLFKFDQNTFSIIENTRFYYDHQVREYVGREEFGKFMGIAPWYILFVVVMSSGVANFVQDLTSSNITRKLLYITANSNSVSAYLKLLLVDIVFAIFLSALNLSLLYLGVIFVDLASSLLGFSSNYTSSFNDKFLGFFDSRRDPEYWWIVGLILSTKVPTIIHVISLIVNIFVYFIYKLVVQLKKLANENHKSEIISIKFYSHHNTMLIVSILLALLIQMFDGVRGLL